MQYRSKQAVDHKLVERQRRLAVYARHAKNQVDMLFSDELPDSFVRDRSVVLQLEDEILTTLHTTLASFGGDVRAALAAYVRWHIDVEKYFNSRVVGSV
jgi:hypothetical protein